MSATPRADTINPTTPHTMNQCHNGICPYSTVLRSWVMI